MAPRIQNLNMVESYWMPRGGPAPLSDAADSWSRFIVASCAERMASMDDPRDIQNFGRNERARATVSSGSSLAMEMKRKKIRQSAVFLPKEEKFMKRCTSLNDTLQIVADMNLLYIRQISKKIKDCSMPEKIDFEVRMREGAYKLLVASTKRDQILNASKSLLTCNARIKTYVTELQKRKEDLDAQAATKGRLSDPVSKDREACMGKVALSGLRIPLMWKDSDHFSNKGSSRRVAVFCLMKIGAQIFDTEMVVVDKSATDICFEGVTIFSQARPQFELTLELYSCAVDEDASLVNTPKKLAKKLRNSLGKAAGKKLCPLLEDGDPESFLQSHPIPPASRYSLLAYTTLGLAQAEGSFQSHSLIVAQNAENSSWLPLYGSLCCRLVAQPDCMTQEMMSGYLNQQSVGGVSRSCSLYCVLKGGSLACYYSPEEIQAKVEPAQTIPINKDTRIRVMDKAHRQGSNSLNITNPAEGQAAESSVFTADSRDELQDWAEACWQHLHDQAAWQHCGNELMKIEVMSPRKPPLFQTRHADSVYNDLSIGSPGKFEGLTDIIHDKIEESGGRYLIGQEEKTEAPDWSALFGGSRPLMMQKSVLSPSRDDGQPSPNCSGPKKRRAPPPPPDKQPYTPTADSTGHTPFNSNPCVSTITRTPCISSITSAPHAPLDNAPYASSITSAPYVSSITSAPNARSIISAPNTSRLASTPCALLNSAPYGLRLASALQQDQQKQRKPGTCSGRPSLDAKFSAIIQQLQKNHGSAPKPAPVHQLDSENQPPDRPPPPVPAPRHKHKSFREKINPKAW